MAKTVEIDFEVHSDMSFTIDSFKLLQVNPAEEQEQIDQYFRNQAKIRKEKEANNQRRKPKMHPNIKQ